MKKLSLLLSIFLLSLFSLSLVSVSANEPLFLGLPPVWEPRINNGQSITVLQNSGNLVYDQDLQSADPYGRAYDPEGGSLTFTVTDDISKVDCSLVSPGPLGIPSLSGIPASGFTGTTTCTVKATDIEGLSTNDVVTIIVNPINQLQSLEVTGDALSSNLLVIAAPKDYDDDMQLTFKNTGTTALTFPASAVATSGTFADADGDAIIFTFSNVPTSLAPSATHTMTLHFEIDKDVDIDNYPINNDGKLRITTNQFTKEINLRVDVSPEDVCEDGRRADGRYTQSNNDGWLRVTDFDVDPDDEFGPGETIEITNVEVTNDGDADVDDVIVEAILYNIDRDEVVARAESNSENVDEDDSVDFDDFELEVPIDSSDLDEEDNYILYLQAFEDGNTDENCNYDSVDGMEFQRDDNDVRIIKASVTPSAVMCNANANFVVEVRNVGNDDDDRVYIQLKEQELGLDYQSDFFSLDQFDDRNDAATVTYTYKIPSNAEEKAYNVEAIVVFDGGRETDSEFITLTVRDCGVSAGEGNARISLLQGSITAVPGKLFGFPFKLANLETETQQYLVEITPVGGWASQPQSQLVTLQAGQETTLYSYITPKSDLTSGSYSLNIEVKQDSNVVAKQTAAVQVNSDGGEITGGSTFQPSINLSSVWRNLAGSTAFWIVAIIVLFALVIYVLTILLRPR
mgnify:CR=1 FL=1